ncbi:hypothetical protein GCM10022225_65020 [Plantactinospora mayteni]|uniref:Exo-alpha-sialidase n=1 Tax=Plantactinospora mayteni TaxID=566021 RepID=A0ABQ4F0I4_9ACTN|nr:hypothetical protein [Plantactinospora mayteni]GIH00427.1 hypothetical protein Pma05_69990 [Plantactinospora mayteni]
MHEPHFDGLRTYADDAARQPDFAVIRQRAARVRRHRRRATASSVAVVIAALVATSLGYAVTGGPQIAAPTPSPSVDPDTGWPRVTSVVATGPADLYAVVERCRDCGPELYASDDAGATWLRRSVPPTADSAAPSPSAVIVPLGRGVLAWQQLRVVSLKELEPSRSPQVSPSAEPADGAPSPSATDRLWTTVDEGRTWRRAVVEPEPVATVPAGTRPVDCRFVGQPSPCQLYTVNPASGRFAPLAHQPTGITVQDWWTGQTNIPLGAHLWVPGVDPVTNKPAIAASSDRGRTWRTHVFTAGVPATVNHGRIAGMYLPTVAADAGGTAYALIRRDDNVQDPYRTTDGGTTWLPLPGGAVADVPGPGFVTADGAHVLLSDQGLRVNRDGSRYQPMRLPGCPAELTQLGAITPSHQAAGRYLIFSDQRICLSDDGWTWRTVTVP